MPEQEKAVGIMASEIPQERFPEFVAWMFPLMGQDDENMTRIWQMVMSAPAFAGAKELIKKAVGSAGPNSHSASQHYRPHFQQVKELAFPESWS